MEEMQQSVENAELQNDKQQTEVGTGPTNRELLEAMIGLDNPITDDVQTGEDDNITDDKGEEMPEDDTASKSFYTASELFTLIKNNQEIDDSRMTDELRELQNSMLDYKKSLQGDYTKKTQKLAQEKKTLDEELQAFQKKQEQAKLEQEANNNGLSTDDMLNINEIVLNYFKKQGEEYDSTNERHKVIYDDVKKNIINQVVTGRKNNKIQAQFESDCKARYGDNFSKVKEKAKEILNNYPHSKAVAIEQAIREYNVNVAYALLDEAYKQLQPQPQQEQQTQAQQTQAKKPVIIPPHSVARSNVPPKKTNKEWQNYI